VLFILMSILQLDITQFLRILHKSGYENGNMQMKFATTLQRLFQPVFEKENYYFYRPSSLSEKEDELAGASLPDGEQVLVQPLASLDDERDNSPQLEVRCSPIRHALSLICVEHKQSCPFHLFSEIKRSLSPGRGAVAK